MQLVLALTVTLAFQAPNPPYLAQFPSVQKVKQVMTDKDPREQALKQMGALYQLQEVMKQLSGRREFRGYLPDEMKLLGKYQVAEYNIGKAIDSAFPGPYGSWRKVSDNRPYAYMRSDQRFGIEGIQTFRLLLNSEIQTAFYTSVGLDQARIAARMHADSEAMLAARAAGENPSGGKTDAETRAIRRCAESGRSEMQCMMEGIGKSFTGMISAVLPGLPLKSAPIRGIRMSGVYPGEGKLGFTFYNDQVTVGCSDIVPESHNYTVAVAPSGLRITIDNAPRPVVLTLRPDGRLQGSGPTDFPGQVPVGIASGTSSAELPRQGSASPSTTRLGRWCSPCAPTDGSRGAAPPTSPARCRSGASTAPAPGRTGAPSRSRGRSTRPARCAATSGCSPRPPRRRRWGA